MPRHRKIEAMHDFVTTLALQSRMLGSVWYAICPCPSRTIAGSASKAKRWRSLSNQNFHKKVHVNFPKSYISGITKVSGFEWDASLILSSPTPSTKPYDAGDCLQVVCALLQNRLEVFSMENWPLGSSQVRHLAPRSGPEVVPVEAPLSPGGHF